MAAFVTDHIALIYSMVQTSFQKIEPKKLVYRNYTSFLEDSLLTDLSNPVQDSQCYEVFEAKTVEVLVKHAPGKTSFLRGGYKLHASKKLRKDIIKGSQLKCF